MDCQTSQRILQARAKEAMSACPRCRFPSQSSAQDRFASDVGELEKGYIQFLGWFGEPGKNVYPDINGAGSKSWPHLAVSPPGVCYYHPNSLRGVQHLSRRHDPADELSSRLTEGFSKNPAIKRAAEIIMGKGLAGSLDFILDMQGELALTIPVYWPDITRSQREVPGSHWAYLALSLSYKTIGVEETTRILREKVPLFPPLVHERRMRTIDAGLEVLEALLESIPGSGP